MVLGMKKGILRQRYLTLTCFWNQSWYLFCWPNRTCNIWINKLSISSPCQTIIYSTIKQILIWTKGVDYAPLVIDNCFSSVLILPYLCTLLFGQLHFFILWDLRDQHFPFHCDLLPHLNVLNIHVSTLHEYFTLSSEQIYYIVHPPNMLGSSYFLYKEEKVRNYEKSSADVLWLALVIQTCLIFSFLCVGIINTTRDKENQTLNWFIH